MWAIIKIGTPLKFYDFKIGQYVIIGDIRYGEIDELKDLNGASIAHNGITDKVLDHDKCVSNLLSAGIPFFLKKEDARKAATEINLTGYKYYKFEPAIVKL